MKCLPNISKHWSLWIALHTYFLTLLTFLPLWNEMDLSVSFSLSSSFHGATNGPHVTQLPSMGTISSLRKAWTNVRVLTGEEIIWRVEIPLHLIKHLEIKSFDHLHWWVACPKTREAAPLINQTMPKPLNYPLPQSPTAPPGLYLIYQWPPGPPRGPAVRRPSGGEALVDEERLVSPGGWDLLVLMVPVLFRR